MKIKCVEKLTPLLSAYVQSQSLGIEKDPFGLAVSKKTGLPAKRIVPYFLKDHWGKLDDSIKWFLVKNKETYIVPIDDFTHNIYGFLFRSVRDKYYRIYHGSEILFYGLQDFTQFTYDQPIIFTEGVKEAEAFKRFGYIFTLALLTGTFSYAQSVIAKNLTKHPIFVVDNDTAGRKNMEYMKSRWNIQCFVPPEKDVGMLFEDHKPETEEFIQSVVNYVRGLK